MMTIAAFTIACVACLLAIVALLTALDARNFWHELLMAYQEAERQRGRLPGPTRQPYPRGQA